jgi:tetratricopeptide (TPR) repeat protein
MHRTATTLLAFALAALAGWALWPGISGDFLFDDYVNLPALGQYGPVDNERTLIWYLTVGLGDPVGRPLSMLSFLIDARDWPAPAAPFLRTNILLHLLNGLLLMRVLSRLAFARTAAAATSDSEMSTSEASAQHSAAIAAVLAGGFWMLHPLWLSTTLYVVQRESMLAATFALLGFLAWLAGRARLDRGAKRSGFALLAIGSFGCTCLAMLCKANGVLLPLLLLVAEATVLPALQQPAARASLARSRRWLLYTPCLLLALGLFSKLPASIEMARDARPWTLGERLLSEPRVIADYLRLLLLPHPLSGGVFRDDYPVSTSLWQPWTTLPAILLLAGLATLGWCRRRRWPLLSFAILFFLSGHALEGSIVPLELYFEHRNYLPSMALFFPLATWLTLRGPMPLLRYGAALTMVALLAFDTRVGATIWGQPTRLAQTWATQSPNSSRAQATAAQYEMQQGRADLARTRLHAALVAHPDDAQLAFNLADAECTLGGLDPAVLDAIRQALRTSANTARLGFDWLSRATATAQENTCPGLDLDAIDSMLSALRNNPHFIDVPSRQQDFLHVEGLIALARGKPDAAFAAFERGIAILPRAKTALRQAALLATAGRPDLGLEHLEDYERLPQPQLRPWPTMANVHAWLLQRDGYWDREVARMHAQLAEDVRAMHAAPTTRPASTTTQHDE